MRKYLNGGLVLALALAVGTVGSATGKSTFTTNGHEQGLDLIVSKRGKQSVVRSGPLAISGEDYLSPQTQPRKAGRVRLLFDRGLTLRPGKFPRCSKSERQSLEGTSSEDAKRICGLKTQLSKDGARKSAATAAINFGASGIAVVHPVVTAFNGPKKNGRSTLILHTFLSSPVANTTVLDGVWKRKDRRWLLDVNKIPPLAGGLGSLTDFYTTINAQRKRKGKRISYFEVDCKKGRYKLDGTWNMGDYTNPSDIDSFVTEFRIRGTEVQKCSRRTNDTKADWDPGPGR